MLDMETERLLRAHLLITAAFRSLRPTDDLLKACYRAIALVYQ